MDSLRISMKNNYQRFLLVSLSAFLNFILINTAVAGGFQAEVQSVSALGTANAGSAAVTDNVSHQFYNPAILSQFNHSELSVSSMLGSIRVSYQDRGTEDEFGNPIEGEGGPQNVLELVPSLYYVMPVTDSLSYGLSINTPFGAATRYDESWVGRYNSIRSKLVTYNFNPAFGYEINDRISIGAGVSFQYLDLDILTALNTRTSCASAIGGDLILCEALERFFQSTPDLIADMPIYSWGVGWNAGALFRLFEQTHIGLSYRSEVSHKGTGAVHLNVKDSELLSLLSPVIPTQFKLDVSMPMMASLSIDSLLGYNTSILADVTWVGWSTYKDFEAEFVNINGGISLPQNWQDTWRFALGFEHQYSPSLLFRVGGAIDYTPVTDQEFRNSIVPDSDRFWFSLGLNYQFSQDVDMDFGFAHVITNKVSAKNAGITDDVLIGEFQNEVDILGVQLNWKF